MYTWILALKHTSTEHVVISKHFFKYELLGCRVDFSGGF